jgi:hypothetical protein
MDEDDFLPDVGGGGLINGLINYLSNGSLLLLVYFLLLLILLKFLISEQSKTWRLVVRGIPFHEYNWLLHGT